MKYPSIIALSLLSLIVQSCGSGSNPPATSSDNRSAMAETPSVPAADPSLKSESKGVGIFTSAEVGPPDSKLADKGAALFQTKCVSCHLLSDQKTVGPGLKGITTIRTPQWIMNMTYAPEEMVRRDVVAKALKEQYKLPMMIPDGITEDECRAVFEFLRASDQKQ